MKRLIVTGKPIKKAAQFAPAAPATATPIQRGSNPVTASTRPDAKRPGRPRKEAQVAA